MLGAFKLSSNESPFPPLPSIRDAVSGASLNRYPDASAGVLRTRLAARHHVTPDEIHVASGSVAILQQLLLAASAPNTEVVYAWRSFEAYPGLVTVTGATSVQVPLRSDGRHDLDAIAAAVTPATRAVIICSPNNPTGTTVTQSEFVAFMSRLSKTVLVILDEAYAEFVTDPNAVNGTTLLRVYSNLVVLRTFSKAYGLAGLRVGYAIGPAYILKAAHSTAIPLSVTEPAQRAALAALDAEPELLERVEVLIKRRDEIVDALDAQGWTIPATHGNFIWLPTGIQTFAAAEILETHAIIARIFPFEGLRVSVGEPESVEPFLTATADILRTLR